MTIAASPRMLERVYAHLEGAGHAATLADLGRIDCARHPQHDFSETPLTDHEGSRRVYTWSSDGRRPELAGGSNHPGEWNMEKIVKMAGRKYLVRQDLPGTWTAWVWDDVARHYSFRGVTVRQEQMAIRRAIAALREDGELA